MNYSLFDMRRAVAKRNEKDWRVDMFQYPRTDTVAILALRHLVGDSLIAAEVFADDYRDDLKSLEEEESPPCIGCGDKTIYFCYLTGIVCRKWVVWSDEAGR